MNNKFLISFDTDGFELILNITTFEKEQFLADIKNDGTTIGLVSTLSNLLMRARLNPQRNPEIWIVEATVNEDQLRQISLKSPQELVDLIRKHGKNIYKTTTGRKQTII